MGGIITTLNSYEFLNTVVIVFVCDNTPNRFRFYGPMTMNFFPLSNVKGTSIWCYPPLSNLSIGSRRQYMAAASGLCTPKIMFIFQKLVLLKGKLNY